MRKFVLFLAFVAWIFPGFANYIDSSVYCYGVPYSFSGDSFITEAGGIFADRINIDESLTIINRGIIAADIYIMENSHLFLQNAGEFDGDIYLEHGSKITQVITDNEDITFLGISDNFDILVQNANKISLNNVMLLGSRADKISIRDSTLVLVPESVAVFAAKAPGIEISGDVVIYVENFSDIPSEPFLRGVSGSGTLYVYSDNADPLYVLQTYMDGEDLFLRQVRSIDYATILGGGQGTFLNMLRMVNPDDSLLLRLDNANDMKEIARIMGRSVRLQPKNLMHVVDVFNTLERISTGAAPDNMSINISPFFEFSKDWYLYGMRARTGIGVMEKVAVSFSAYAAIADYADDINEYSAGLYGGNLSLLYDATQSVFMRALAGFSFADFDVGPVFDDGNVAYNPHGKSFYSYVDAGNKFSLFSDFYISPFLGIGVGYEKILGAADMNLTGRIGADASYGFEMAGLRYDYGLHAIYEGDGVMGGEVHMNILSIADGAGSNIAIGMVNTHYGMAYKINIGAAFYF